MPYILIRQKVRDFAEWKAVFDEHGTMRKATGSKGGYILRNNDDPSEVLVLLEVEDLGRARQFVRSEDLRRAMQRAGVVDQPTIYFLDEAGRPAA